MNAEQAREILKNATFNEKDEKLKDLLKGIYMLIEEAAKKGYSEVGPITAEGVTSPEVLSELKRNGFNYTEYVVFDSIIIKW